MSLFDRLQGGQGAQAPQQILQQLRADPVGTLRQRGLNIPQGMTNPQQIVSHLMQTGQIANSRLQQAMQMIGRR